jgi:hypothetical protein
MYALLDELIARRGAGGAPGFAQAFIAAAIERAPMEREGNACYLTNS